MRKSLAEYVWEKTEEHRRIPMHENNKCFREAVFEAIEEWFKQEFMFYEKPQNSIGILAFLDRENKSLSLVIANMRREIEEANRSFRR